PRSCASDRGGRRHCCPSSRPVRSGAGGSFPSMSAAISSDRPGGGPPAPAAPEGLVLGRLLGSGGWGTVYEARLARDLPWGRSGERVAVKFLRSDRFGDPAALGRFLREGHLSRRIEPPGVVRVLAAGGEPGPGGPQPYLVLE